MTKKMIQNICATYGNIISSDWILTGMGNMLNRREMVRYNAISEEVLLSLSNEELASLVKELIVLHNEQTEMHHTLTHQYEKMIHNGQERINSITNIILKSFNYGSFRAAKEDVFYLIWIYFQL